VRWQASRWKATRVAENRASTRGDLWEPGFTTRGRCRCRKFDRGSVQTKDAASFPGPKASQKARKISSQGARATARLKAADANRASARERVWEPGFTTRGRCRCRKVDRGSVQTKDAASFSRPEASQKARERSSQGAPETARLKAADESRASTEESVWEPGVATRGL